MIIQSTTSSGQQMNKPDVTLPYFHNITSNIKMLQQLMKLTLIQTQLSVRIRNNSLTH